MNQKFILSREDGKIQLKEMSELEPGMFQKLYEDEFDEDQFNPDMEIDELISIIRNKSFYPPNEAAKVIADGFKEFLGSDDEKAEIRFNDKDMIINEELEEEEDIPVDVDVDELLSDDDIGSDDDNDLKDLKVQDVDKDEK